MAQVDAEYHYLLNLILNHGTKKIDRTGTGTISVFGTKLRFDLRNNKLPLITTKKMFTKGVVYELFWFLGYHMTLPEYKQYGLTNIKWLVDNNVNIWVGDAYKRYTTWLNNGSPGSLYPEELTSEQFINKIKLDNDFAREWGELGPVYGQQWINWTISENKHINQIQRLIYDLKNNPDSRRLIVTAWNPADVDASVLPPCHYGFQCWTRELSLVEREKLYLKKFPKPHLMAEEMIHSQGHEYFNTYNIPTRALSLQWHQRSVDTAIGLSFNIASYAILTHILAHCTNMVAEELIFDGGDTHIYNNHIEGVMVQLERDVNKYESATIRIEPDITKDIWKLSPGFVKICDYDSYPKIEFPLSN